MGIFSDGMRIPSATQVANGSILGHGVYFADSVSKSFNYCSTCSTGDVGLVLICEVALGESQHVYSPNASALPSQFQSRFAHGSMIPDPSLALVDPPGFERSNPKVVMPCGSLIPSGRLHSYSYYGGDDTKTSFIYNEYVIYTQHAYRFRYLLKLRRT